MKTELKSSAEEIPDVKSVKKNIIISVIVILTVLSHYYLKYFYAYLIFGKDHYNRLYVWQQTILIQTLGLALCFFVVGALASFSFKRMKKMLGLDKGLIKPLIYVLIATLPSFVGYALLNGYSHATLFDIAWYSFWPGFNEEIVYRAFIVGILVRYAHWNFVLAALGSGFIFASVHLYQASDFFDGLKIFLLTSGAGIGFSFFYKFWNWNIWFTIFLHTLMNLAWILFVFQGTALMSGTENIFRFITIGLAIIFTIYHYAQSKRQKQ